jgi:hypothetical protein
MRKAGGCLLILIIGAALGLFVGSRLGDAINAGALERWRDFSLPGATKRIVSRRANSRESTSSPMKIVLLVSG